MAPVSFQLAGLLRSCKLLCMAQREPTEYPLAQSEDWRNAARDPAIAAARARAQQAMTESKKTRQVRIDLVTDLIADGKWSTAKRLELARTWGCSLECVKEYSDV